jgi:hypothetical protein
MILAASFEMVMIIHLLLALIVIRLEKEQSSIAI